MAMGLIGRKAGMTRVFTEAGETVPVTVIEVLPNRVTQVKSAEKDGYRAVQVSFGERRPQLLSKALAGHYAKAKVAPGKALVEFRLTDKEQSDLAPGAELKADLFQAGAVVDVTGTTIGTILQVAWPHTVTLCPTVRRGLSASGKRRGGYFKASACPATWVSFAVRLRIYGWSKSTPNAT
jgi:hypothetical protein